MFFYYRIKNVIISLFGGDKVYQALYRKYRPSVFDDVIGQTVIVKTLKNAITNNKLTHAYLFTGPRGTGKTSTAKILAKTINCENLENFIPCGQCNSCIQIYNKQSTDIIEIDAASNNGVDEIRELKSKVNLVPANSKYKVYIIDEVHMLSTGAFNALLKTLEEPPSHVIFILATTEPHKIPATILSRCQRFDFKKVSKNHIVELLKKISENEKIDIEDQALNEIALLAQGGVRDSISMLDQAISYCNNHITSEDIQDINGTIDNDQIKKIIEFLFKKNIVSILKKIDELDQKGKNFIKLTEKMIHYMRNVLICKLTPNYFEISEQKEYENIIEKNDVNLLFSYIKYFSEALSKMKDSDDEKLTLELYLIEMLNLGDAKKIDFIERNKDVEPTEKKAEENQSLDELISNKIQLETQSARESLDQHDLDLIKKIKYIRINNTLSSFSKKVLIFCKQKIELIKKYLIDEQYGKWVALILDGELKAAGKNYLIFVYKDEAMENLFNQNWCHIEKILEKVYQENVKVVATSLEEWNQIRLEFNSKTKKYEWQEEPSLKYSEPMTINKNNIENLFEDIIEYNE